MPQPRPRFYLVALLRPVADRRFVFPVGLPTPGLLRFLGPPGPEAAAPFPCSPQANTSLLAACEKLRARKVDAAATPCVVGVGSSSNGGGPCHGALQPLPNGDPLLPRRPLHRNVQALSLIHISEPTRPY